MLSLLFPPPTTPGNRSNTVKSLWSQRNGSDVNSLPSERVSIGICSWKRKERRRVKKKSKGRERRETEKRGGRGGKQRRGEGEEGNREEGREKEERGRRRRSD